MFMTSASVVAQPGRRPVGPVAAVTRCPVCWRGISQTPWKTIPQHMDTLHNPCPASGEPIHIAITNMLEDATA